MPLPMSKNSQTVPELVDITPLRSKQLPTTIPKKLQLTPGCRAKIETKIEFEGLDNFRYDYTMKDQGK